MTTIPRYNSMSVYKHQNLIWQAIENLDVTEVTRKDYRYRTDIFLSYTTEHGLTRNTFIDYKRYLGSQKFAVSTKNKYLTCARLLIRELNRLGAIPVDITQNVRSFKQGRLHKRDGVTEDEMKRLVAVLAKMPDDERTLRLKAMFSLLAFQGLREIEVCRLEDVEKTLPLGYIMIRGKGRDDGERISVSSPIIRHIRRYLKIQTNTKGALFTSLNRHLRAPIGTRTVQNEVIRLFRMAGVDKTVHGLRHYYVTSLLKVMDMRSVRQYSRHKSFDMLITYDDELGLERTKKTAFGCFAGSRF